MSELINFSPCDFSELSSGKYKKVTLSNEQKSQLSFALSQMPEIAAADAVSKLYVLKYPEGVAGSLMQYKTGGLGTTVMANGRIAGHADLYNLASLAAPAQLFTLMSLVTGQHYLSVINSEIAIINQKMDKILDFLYGEKKAELMAEINFVQYAYDNYVSIMQHEQQRTATIASLQSAKKIAMKDVEFYLNDIELKSNSKDKDQGKFMHTLEDAFNSHKSLEYALQLFVMSGIMEVYYSQNKDASYLSYLESDMTMYIEKCNHQITTVFSKLAGKNENFLAANDGKLKIPFQKRTDTSESEARIQMILKSAAPDRSEMKDTIINSFNAFVSQPEYCISTDGDLYIAG
jgi:hypothetical protein